MASGLFRGFVSPQEEGECNRLGRRRRSGTVSNDYNSSQGETRLKK